MGDHRGHDLPPPSTDLIELRADRAQLRRSRLRSLLLLAGLMGLPALWTLDNLLDRDHRGVAVMGTWWGVVVLGAVLHRVRLSTSVVVLAPDRITVRSRLTPARHVMLPIDAGLLATIDFDVLVIERVLAIRGRHGRRIRLSDVNWSRDDLATIARHAGVHSIDGGVVGRREFRDRASAAMTWYERRPALAACTILGAFAFIIAIDAVVRSVY